ncbi:MAG: CapA family protein [Patescibacteria group bacterium]
MKRIFSYAFWISFSVFSGVFLTFLLAKAADSSFNYLANLIDFKPMVYVNQSVSYASDNYKETKNDGGAIRETKPFPSISAEAFLVADIKNGTITQQKNKEEILPIASITKLMVAAVSIETLNQHNPIAITEEILKEGYGNYGSLRSGETITAGEMLYPLLLESSNDAAVALATARGKENFIKLMNQKAGALGMLNTNFEESSGISEKNTSTAQDLFLMAQHLYNNEKWILNITKKEEFRFWKNNSSFAGDERYLGGKNGYTEASFDTALALFSLPSKESENKDMAIILLRSQNRKKDINAILTWLESEESPSIKGASLIFVGDIMLDRDVEKSVINNGGDFSFLFQKAGFIKEYDIAFGNLEGPVSDKGGDLNNLYSFRMRPEALSALKEAGFDVLSVANNHTGDWGKNAFEDTLFRLEKENILAVGGGLSKSDAARPKIIGVNELKIGFLGFSDLGPNWLKAAQDKAGILITDESFVEIVGEAAKEVDALIVSLHFGEEYQKIHNKRQEYLSRAAIDNGARIVIGHHPHVAQDTEEYKDGLIAYSLGNFIFDQDFSEETMKGAALEIILAKNGTIKSSQIKTIQLNRFYQPELID